jgi:hypothetical protein
MQLITGLIIIASGILAIKGLTLPLFLKAPLIVMIISAGAVNIFSHFTKKYKGFRQ